jgi:diguanylate cyclase (GGDEF)-like protein
LTSTTSKRSTTPGHEVGDVLLKAIAVRLSQTLRSTDTIARLGGDEFTIDMEELSKPEDAENVAAKIVQAMQVPFDLDQASASVSVSIGLAFYQGGMLEPKTLIKQADEMLYRAKKEGRNTYRVAPMAVS